MLPKTSAYLKSYDGQTKWMYFLTEDDDPVITIDSALKKEEKFYLQVFLKECKYIEKEVIGHIIGDPKIFLISLINSFHYFKTQQYFWMRWVV